MVPPSCFSVLFRQKRLLHGNLSKQAQLFQSSSHCVVLNVLSETCGVGDVALSRNTARFDLGVNVLGRTLVLLKTGNCRKV